MISPHGGILIDQMCSPTERNDWLDKFSSMPKVSLDEDQLMELENIGMGLYSPLKGFMKRDTYQSVVNDMRLPGGLAWSIPIVLGVDFAQVERIRNYAEVALTDLNGKLCGILHLEEIFQADKDEEAHKVYLTNDSGHPGVEALYKRGEYLLGGEVRLISENLGETWGKHYLTPSQTRAYFSFKEWRKVVGFQTRNPIHRAHEYIQKCALEISDALFLNPLIGRTKSDDVSARVRLESYKILLEKYYPQERILLSVFPAPMHYAGPKEAVFHAICRQNYGCTHFIVGRDHAGVGGYYGTYDAQIIFRDFKPEELAIQTLCYENTFYCKKCGNMASLKTCPHDAGQHLILSGTQVRRMLQNGESPPEEYTRPEVAEILIKAMQVGKI